MRLPSQRLVRVTSQLVTTVALGAIAIHSASAADLVVPVIPAPIYVPPPPPPQPSFYAGIAALYMTRSTPAVAPIIDAPVARVIGPLPDEDPANVLDASDFDFGFVFGLEGRAGVILPNGLIGFEVGGFWLRPWTATVEDEGGTFGTVFVQTNPETQTGLDGFEAINATRLFGVDANVVAHLNGGALQVYAGAAYIRLRDQMVIFADMDAPDQIWTWETDNRLIGPQIGARYVIGNSSPFSLELGARVGFLHNGVSNSVLIEKTSGNLTGADADSIWTFMAAGSITARFNVTENVALTAGYEALWLKDVALAPHQVGATGPIDAVGPGTVALDTFVAPFLAHGFTAGLSIRF